MNQTAESVAIGVARIVACIDAGMPTRDYGMLIGG